MKHLQNLRVISVILLFGLAVYSVWSVIRQPRGPVTQLFNDKTAIISGGDITQPIRYKLAYKKNRTDCALAKRRDTERYRGLHGGIAGIFKNAICMQALHGLPFIPYAYLYTGGGRLKRTYLTSLLHRVGMHP